MNKSEFDEKVLEYFDKRKGKNVYVEALGNFCQKLDERGSDIFWNGTDRDSIMYQLIDKGWVYYGENLRVDKQHWKYNKWLEAPVKELINHPVIQAALERNIVTRFE